jgi:Fic family protein
VGSQTHAPSRCRSACRYEAFVPDGLASHEFDLPSTVTGVVSDAERAIMRLNIADSPACSPLARLLLRTESIASSRVEGLQVGCRELARGESRLETGRGASPTVREVLGNIESIQLALDQAASADRIGIGHLIAIHRELMESAPNSRIAGVLRTDQNWIGGNAYNPCGADFVPPPPEYVVPLLEDLCDVLDDESLPPVVHAALAHAQFETIHPFDDGNGRTGRALIHLVLRRRGIASAYVPPISVVLAGKRDHYIDGLTRFRQGEVGEWVEQFSAAAATAADLASAYLGAVSALTEEWRDRLSSGAAPRADAAAWVLIEILPGHPVVTAPVAATVTGRARAAIHQAIQQLVECGVLLPLSESKRNRSWEAAGLVDLLERLESGLPPSPPLRRP